MSYCTHNFTDWVHNYMAAKTDLTWQELNNALVAMGYTNAVVVSGGKVMVDVGIITGVATTALTQGGVCEFMYKMRQGAGNAQETVNATIVNTAEQLTSFPPFSYSNPTVDGLVGVTQISAYLIPLNLDSVFGTN